MSVQESIPQDGNLQGGAAVMAGKRRDESVNSVETPSTASQRLASSPGPILILKLAGTKNRAWYRLARSWRACASHSPESGESCTVVLWFVIFSVYLVGSPRKLYLVPDRRICVARGFA